MGTLMVMAQAESQGAMGGGFGQMLPMLLLMIGLFYFMLIRPQQRKAKELAKMINELRAGERIMFGGGLIGTVAEVREHTFLVEVASKVNIEIARGAVLRTLAKDETPVLDEQRK
jgi:preprotein translocase subunit YajC